MATRISWFPKEEWRERGERGGEKVVLIQLPMYCLLSRSEVVKFMSAFIHVQ